MNGWIKLYRKFTNWEWFKDINTCHLFIYCLLKANIKDTTWRGQAIKRGQFITSLNSLSHETGLTIRQVRTALEKLEMTNELTNLSSPQNTVITIKKYNQYQIATNDSTRKLTTDKEDKKKRNKNNISYINNLSLNKGEREILEKYLLSIKRKTPIDDIDAYIDTLIRNGSVETKLEKAKQWIEKKKQREEQKRKEQKIQKQKKADEEREVENVDLEEVHKKIQEMFKKNGVRKL
jgi:hypothetical protein